MARTARIAPVRRAGPAGFTLVELLVVLVIAVSAMTVVVPRFVQSLESVRLVQATREAAALLRAARADAIRNAVTVGVELDLEQGLIRSTDGRQAYAVPEDLVMSVPGRFPGADRQPARIEFHADGTASGGGLRIASERRGRTIRVDWFTGRVSLD